MFQPRTQKARTPCSFVARGSVCAGGADGAGVPVPPPQPASATRTPTVAVVPLRRAITRRVNVVAARWRQANFAVAAVFGRSVGGPPRVEWPGGYSKTAPLVWGPPTGAS